MPCGGKNAEKSIIGGSGPYNMCLINAFGPLLSIVRFVLRGAQGRGQFHVMIDY